MKAIDLFCGCGGFSEGARRAGIDVLGGFDVNETALRVYSQNHKRAIRHDLSDIDKTIDIVRNLDYNIVLASPPCQDFSNSGNHVESDRAELFETTCKFICQTRPVVAILENVPYLLRTRTFERARQLWLDSGFSVTCLKIVATACSLPQARTRIFILVTRDISSTQLSSLVRDMQAFQTTPDPPPMIAECLDDTSRPFVWHVARNRWQPCVRSAREPLPTLRCNCTALPPANYVRRYDDAGDVTDVHVLSVEELSRASGFKPDYFGATSRAASGKLLGNCVPPPMAEVLLRRILKLRASSRTREIPTFIGGAKPFGKKQSRIARLEAAGVASMKGFEMSNEPTKSIRYRFGASPDGDAIISELLKWTPKRNWTIVVKERSNQASNNDDIYIYLPGQSVEYRSLAQLKRAGKC